MTGFINDLIGGFTGSNAKGRLDDGKAQFDAAAKDGFNLANTNFSTGYTQATNNIVDARKRAEAGYGSAENSVKWGAADASSRIGTGAAKQAGAINDAFDQAFSSAGKGFDTARGDINTSTDKALGFQRDALGNAISVLRPGIDAYKGYEGIVQNYAGVNGPQAQSDAFSSFTDTNSPLVQARNARANEELQAFQNARGITGGRAAMAASRAVAQRQADDYANYMANIQQAAGRTGSMAGQAASMTNAAGANEAALEAARGRSLGDLSTGQAALEASLATGRGGALSGIYGHEADAQAANSNAVGRGVADIRIGGTNAENDLLKTQAGLDTNYYGAMAQNASNYYNRQADAATAYNSALAGNEGTLFKNVLGLGSAAVSAFAPVNTYGLNSAGTGIVPTGTTSAAGNIWGALKGGYNYLTNGGSSPLASGGADTINFSGR